MVVPAFNEEKLISRVLETIPAIVDRVIVVDDASTDRTPEILCEAGRLMGDRLKVDTRTGDYLTREK